MATSATQLFGLPPAVYSSAFAPWADALVARRVADVPLSQGTQYYIDASGGSDANDGLSAGAPKQTLSAAQTIINAATAGATINLKRGSVWRVTSGSGLVLSAANVTVRDYGTGPLPRISRRKVYTSGWTIVTGTRYSRTETDSVRGLWSGADMTTPYVRDSSATIAAPGQWHWTANTLTVDVGVNPNGLTIEASVTNTGVDGIRLSADRTRAHRVRVDGFGEGPGSSDQSYNIKTAVTGAQEAVVSGCEAYGGRAHTVGHYANGSGGYSTWTGGVYGFVDDTVGTVCNTYADTGGTETIFAGVNVRYGCYPAVSWVTTSVPVAGQAFYGHTGGGGSKIGMTLCLGCVESAGTFAPGRGASFADPSAYRCFIADHRIEPQRGKVAEILQHGVAYAGNVYRLWPIDSNNFGRALLESGGTSSGCYVEWTLTDFAPQGLLRDDSGTTACPLTKVYNGHWRFVGVKPGAGMAYTTWGNVYGDARYDSGGTAYVDNLHFVNSVWSNESSGQPVNVGFGNSRAGFSSRVKGSLFFGANSAGGALGYDAQTASTAAGFAAGTLTSPIEPLVEPFAGSPLYQSGNSAVSASIGPVTDASEAGGELSAAAIAKLESLIVAGGKVASTLAAGDVSGNLPVDVQTIKTQAVTAAAPVTFPATIGTSTYAGGDTAGTTTMLTRLPGVVQPQTGDAYAKAVEAKASADAATTQATAAATSAATAATQSTAGASSATAAATQSAAAATSAASVDGKLTTARAGKIDNLDATVSSVGTSASNATAAATAANTALANIANGTTVVRANDADGAPLATAEAVEGIDGGLTDEQAGWLETLYENDLDRDDAEDVAREVEEAVIDGEGGAEGHDYRIKVYEDGSINARVAFQGDGRVAITHNFGDTDNLRVRKQGTTIGVRSTVRAYSKSEFQLYYGRQYLAPKDSIETDDDGRWLEAMYLSGGITYVLVADPVGEGRSVQMEVTVPDAV
jgi:hypothetical protein